MLQQELPIRPCLALPPWQVKRIGANLQPGQYSGAENRAKEGERKTVAGEEEEAQEPETPRECSESRLSIWLGSEEAVTPSLWE